MRWFVVMLGNIKMTTIIAALVVLSIVGSIAGVSTSIYLNLYSKAIEQSRVQQETNLAVAATILERRISGSTMNWTDDGTMGAFQSWAIPPFYDTEIIDSITRVTQQAATVYVLDTEKQTLVGQTTSIAGADGARATDLALEVSGETYARMQAKEEYLGPISISGVDYFAALKPIEKMDGEVIGAIFVGTPMKDVEATANGVLNLILLVGGMVTVAFGLAGIALSRLITRPIPRLATAMEMIASGDYETVVPFIELSNEVGGMARAVEVFRQNGLRVRKMTEEEAVRIISDREDRQQMMTELQNAFGVVVDAAVAGDFSRQVSGDFPDPELNSLAGGINNLVSTFNRGVTEIGQVLNAMANTNLTQRMEGEYEGAFAALKCDVNSVADKLTEVVAQLRHTSGSLKAATGEILTGANELSERTTRQAATIEETSAAMEQLAATVIKNAQRAREASAGASQVTRTAEESGLVMDEATSAMERITQSSGEISNIIGMIDDIAFQTNLLALNASVEAARAGDAGKGFAVVAVEVRRLAQSAAQASSEVKVLIEKSASEVKTGSRLVGDAATKLKGMLESVRGSSGLLQSIANDSREQASAIEEVTTAVRTMGEMTQHNAALVEETNAAIEQTEAQARELDHIVERFRIGRPETAPTREPDSASANIDRARGLQQRLKANLANYGNAAVQSDWNDF